MSQSFFKLCPKQKQTFFLFQDIRIGSIVPISGRKLSQKNLFSLLALGHTLGQKSRRISPAFLSQSQLFFCLNPMRLIRMEINRCHRLNISNLGSSSVCFHGCRQHIALIIGFSIFDFPNCKNGKCMVLAILIFQLCTIALVIK